MRGFNFFLLLIHTFNFSQKYFNYQLPNDSTTLFGLPMPVQTSVAALRRNLYTSLGEVQVEILFENIERTYF